MGVVDWVRTGSLSTIHPAAAVLTLIGLAMAILFRRSFCSWICPVGFLSESLARLGRRMFGRNYGAAAGLEEDQRAEPRVHRLHGCVAVCPIKDALGMKTAKHHLSLQAYAAAVLVLFFADYFGARVFEVWDNKISDGEYVQRIQENQIDAWTSGNVIANVDHGGQIL